MREQMILAEAKRLWPEFDWVLWAKPPGILITGQAGFGIALRSTPVLKIPLGGNWRPRYAMESIWAYALGAQCAEERLCAVLQTITQRPWVKEAKGRYREQGSMIEHVLVLDAKGVTVRQPSHWQIILAYHCLRGYHDGLQLSREHGTD